MNQDIAFKSLISPTVEKYSQGWFSKRCESGEYNLFCDDQVNQHYGSATSGISHGIWRLRIYLKGFFSL